MKETLAELEVGDAVWFVAPRYGPRLVKATKIGRKWIYIDRGQYDKVTGRENTIYTASYIKTDAMLVLEAREQILRERIRGSKLGEPGWSRRWSVSELEQLLALLVKLGKVGE